MVAEKDVSLRQLDFILETIKKVKNLPRRLSEVKKVLETLYNFYRPEGLSFVGYDEVERRMYQIEFGKVDRNIVDKDIETLDTIRELKAFDNIDGILPVDNYLIPVYFPSGRLVGLLRLFRKRKLNRKEFSLLKASAELIGGYLEINGSARGLLAALIEAQDARIPIEAGHAKRVAVYAEFVGKKLNLGEDDLVDLKQAALLHDIGKLAVPDHIIKKPGRLTPDEYAIIKTHPVVGARILEKSGIFAHISKAVLHHHERWDGAGYPGGLRGENIPLFSRIIAVADSFDAMTSDRPYRRALSWEEARKRLLRGAGSQWDPQVVDVFIDGMEEIEEIVV